MKFKNFLLLLAVVTLTFSCSQEEVVQNEETNFQIETTNLKSPDPCGDCGEPDENGCRFMTCVDPDGSEYEIQCGTCDGSTNKSSITVEKINDLIIRGPEWSNACGDGQFGVQSQYDSTGQIVYRWRGIGGHFVYSSDWNIAQRNCRGIERVAELDAETLKALETGVTRSGGDPWTYCAQGQGRKMCFGGGGQGCAFWVYEVNCGNGWESASLETYRNTCNMVND